MGIRIAGITEDSIVDGEGLRLVLFTQGCPHACPGCHNPETHDLQGGTWLDEEAFLSLIRENPLLDGVTFSGGEPFLQAKELALLAARIRKEFGSRPDFSLMAYTGYTFEELLTRVPSALDFLLELDLLVDGRFIQEKRTLDLLWRGSTNQRILQVPSSLEQKTPVLYMPA